jgi:hypothetical protein
MHALDQGNHWHEHRGVAAPGAPAVIFIFQIQNDGVGTRRGRLCEVLRAVTGDEERDEDMDRRTHAQNACALVQSVPCPLAVHSFRLSLSSLAWSAKASSLKSGERPRKVKRLGGLPRSSAP